MCDHIYDSLVKSTLAVWWTGSFSSSCTQEMPMPDLLFSIPAFTYDFLISYSNRISELFRNRAVQYFEEICGFEICRSKKKIASDLVYSCYWIYSTVFIGQLEYSWVEYHICIWSHTFSENLVHFFILQEKIVLLTD